MGRAAHFFSAFNMQRRVIAALMLREVISHYGRDHLGVFWLMGEPAFLTTIVTISWSIHPHITPTISTVKFVLTGYTLITTWRHVAPHLKGVARDTVSLMFHKNVRFFDAIMARFFLEMAATGLSFITIYCLLVLTRVIDPMYDAGRLVGGWALCGWVVFFRWDCYCWWSAIVPVIEKFVQPIMYVTLPLTGLFFMTSWLPDSFAAVVQYSPLVHCFELARDGIFGHDVEAMYSVAYVVKVNIVLDAIGFFLIWKGRKYIAIE